MSEETIHRGFKYRLSPSKEQEVQLIQWVGNARFVWNRFLCANMWRYQEDRKFFSYGEMCKALTLLKKEEGFEFLKLSSNMTLQQTLRDLHAALMACGKRREGKRRGFPKFKRKGRSKDSLRFSMQFDFRHGAVKIPKMGWVRWGKHRAMRGKPKSITVSRDGDQWFVSVLCEIPHDPPPLSAPLRVTGIDLGIKEVATFSNGEQIPNPRLGRSLEDKIRRAQRDLARKQKGSRNREKAKRKLQRLHRKLRRQREDFLHKISTQIANEYDIVCLENLNVSGMLRNHCLAKALSDVALGKLKRMIRYKVEERGGQILEVSRWFASSKTCSSCGCVKEDLTLSDRIYSCGDCGLEMDRDVNAAINIREQALFELTNE